MAFQGFQVNPQRVAKLNEIPLLFIGLGGTGGDALLRTKHTFYHRFVLDNRDGVMLDVPPRTAFLAIDSDTAMKHKTYMGVGIDEQEWFDLSSSNMRTLIERKALHPWEYEWLDDRFDGVDGGHGASGIRQASRLMLFRKADKLRSVLEGAINDVTAISQGAQGGGKLTIVVATGLAGGTGSGIFLDIAYMIRHICASNGMDYDLISYLVMPDVSIDYAARGDTDRQAIFSVNAFAALKELDYWMSHDQHRQSFAQQYTQTLRDVPWASAPYDDCILLTSQNVFGDRLEDSYGLAMKMVAEHLMHSVANENASFTVKRGDRDDGPSVLQSNDKHSYQSHKNNVHTYIGAMIKPYPVTYRYSTIGSFSTIAQQENMINYEAYRTFEAIARLSGNVPPLEGSTYPGETFARVLDITARAHGEFRDANRLPESFFETNADALRTVKSQRSPSTYHDKRLEEFKQEVSNQTYAFSKRYGQNLMDAFDAFARETIQAPGMGPYYLHRLLTDREYGLLVLLDLHLNKMRSAMSSEKAQQTNLTEQMPRLFKDVTSQGFLGDAISNMFNHRYFSALRDYTSVLRQLYERSRTVIYGDMMIAVYEGVYAYVRLYAEKVLSAYLRDIENMRVTLGEMHTNMVHATTNSALLSFDKMKDIIDKTFDVSQGELVDNTMRLVAEESVTFAHRMADGQEDQGYLGRLFTVKVENLINDAFRKINGANLDVVLEMARAEDADKTKAPADYIANTTAPLLYGGAQAMLCSDGSLAGDPVVEFCYVSVPYDAAEFLQGIKQFAQRRNINATINSSMITDRLMWINTLNGLPLCRYNKLQELEDTYNDRTRANNTIVLRGFHLVMKNLHAPLGQNWSLLPSPIPTVMMRQNISVAQRDAARAVDARLHHAVEKGVLALDRESLRTYTLRYLMTRDGRHPVEPDMVSELVAQVQGDATLTPELRIARFEEYLATARAQSYTAQGDRTKLYQYLGLPLNAWKQETNMSNAQLAAAQEADFCLFEELVFVTLGRQPMTMETIEKQAAHFARVREAMDVNQRAVDERHSEEALARSAVMWIILDLIGILPMRVEYYPQGREGEARRLASTEDYPKEDLAILPELAMVRHVARMDAQFSARAELEEIAARQLACVRDYGNEEMTAFIEVIRPRVAGLERLMAERQRAIGNGSVRYSEETIRQRELSLLEAMMDELALFKLRFRM